MGDGFHKIASRVACAVGSPQAFMLAVAVVAGWGIAGPLVDYSDDWQLFINTGTTVATFLMLFVLQNSQNRDTKAINIKLDELLRAIEGARTGLATVGDLSEAELERIEGEFRKLAAQDEASGASAVPEARDSPSPTSGARISSPCAPAVRAASGRPARR